MGTYHKNFICEYRKMCGFTQQQLGEIVGVDGSQISKYESGEDMPPWDKIEKIASALHTSTKELWGGEKINKAGKSGLDISKGQVIRSELFSTADEIGVTISVEGIQFSTTCVRKWEEVEYIDLLILEDQEILVIRKSTEDALDSKRWSKMKEGRKYSRMLTGRDVCKQIYNMMHWSKGYKFKIKACSTVNADDQDEQIWYFKFKEARGIPMSSRAREKSGIRDEEIDAEVLNALNEVESKKQQDSLRRKQLKEEGKNPGPVELYICYPDEWGQYRFGLPCEIHGIKPEIHLEPRRGGP